MKVLENNYETPINNTFNNSEFEIECEECTSKFSMTTNELNELGEVREYGIIYVKCPCCGKFTATNQDIDINEDNITFPTHFHKISENAKWIGNLEIQKEIENGLKQIKKTNNDYYYWQTGNTYLFIFNMEDEIEIIVCRDGIYESYISKY